MTNSPASSAIQAGVRNLPESHGRIDLQLVTGDLVELERWVLACSQNLQPQSIVALYGDVGAGKTQLISFLRRALGSQEPTQSPSFAIHHTYCGGRLTLDHVDLYRIENIDDLESTGFWDLFAEHCHVIAVEWADRIPRELYPRDWELWEIHLHRL